jgi:hypothetical protein
LLIVNSIKLPFKPIRIGKKLRQTWALDLSPATLNILSPMLMR